MAKIKKKANSKEKTEKIYHDTEKLLKKYRDVVWSIEASVMQAKINFELEFESGIDEFLGMAYLAGADLTGTDIESHIRSIDRSRKMLKIIDNSVEVMRFKHKNGENYYWILYYTYLSEHALNSLDDILERLADPLGSISSKTYYRKRREAIDCLSTLLWGYTSKNCNPIVQSFLD